MARGDDSIARDENTASFNTGQSQETSATDAQTQSINDFQAQVKAKMGQNPWLDPIYQQQLNAVTSAQTHGAADAESTNLDNYSARTGENSADITAAADAGRQAADRSYATTRTAQSLADKNSYENQQMQLMTMLGTVPGQYNSIAGRGADLMGHGASGETSLAAQPSWYDSMINAGVGAAAGIVSAKVGK